MVPFVAEIMLKRAKLAGPGQSVSGGTNSSAGTRIAALTSSESTSAVGSSMRSSSGTAQTHKSRDHVRMTLHKMNHAYTRSQDDDSSDVMEDSHSQCITRDRRMDRKKTISFTSCIRRCDGIFVSLAMENEGLSRTHEMFKEVAMVASLGYLPQDLYNGISIFDMVHPADLINLYEPLQKVISRSHNETGKLWISSPPVRWRSLNSSHALIETRFRLSENSQTILCRHIVVMEPERLDNFFDRVDVQLGHSDAKDEDGAETAKLCRLQTEWGARLRNLLSGTSEGTGEVEPDPPWPTTASGPCSSGTPTVQFRRHTNQGTQEKSVGVNPGSETLLSAGSIASPLQHSSQTIVGPGGPSNDNQIPKDIAMDQQSTLGTRSKRLTGQDRNSIDQPRRVSLKRSRHQQSTASDRRGRANADSDLIGHHQVTQQQQQPPPQQQQQQQQQTPAISRGKKNEDEKQETRPRRERSEESIEGQEIGADESEELNDLCYDSWSQLERVQGYLASVAGFESTCTPPSHLVPSGDNSLAGMLPQSVRDSSLTISNVAHVDFQDQDLEADPDADQHMETDAMAVAMAAAVSAGVRMSPTWSADLGTTSTASLTVENLARHTREQEMAYKRHLWRHLRREHERAVADRTESVKSSTHHHIKRRHLAHGDPMPEHWDHSGMIYPIAVTRAPPNDASQMKRPLMSGATAPPPIYPYMWMIPVVPPVPPVPPYLLYPPGHDNPTSGTGPSPYPPGWDVGVLSRELGSSEQEDSGLGQRWTQADSGPANAGEEEEDEEEEAGQKTRWALGEQTWPCTPMQAALKHQPRPARRHRCQCQTQHVAQGQLRNRHGNVASRAKWQKGRAFRHDQQLQQSRQKNARESSTVGILNQPLHSTVGSRKQRFQYGRTEQSTEDGTEFYRKKQDDMDYFTDGIVEKIDNQASQMGNATVASIAGSSSLFLYDDSSQSSSRQAIGHRPPPFWSRTPSSLPILTEEVSMRYQIPVPCDSRGINLLYKCQLSRLKQSELVIHQLFEMLNIDDNENQERQQTSEGAYAEGPFDDLDNSVNDGDEDDSMVDVDRIISQLLFEGDPSSDASSSDIVTTDDSVTSCDFRESHELTAKDMDVTQAASAETCLKDNPIGDQFRVEEPNNEEISHENLLEKSNTEKKIDDQEGEAKSDKSENVDIDAIEDIG